MEDDLHDDYLDDKASYIDQLYELFDYVPSKKTKKYKLLIANKFASSDLDGDRMRLNMYMYDKYHGKDGWEYNLLTGKLEKKKN